jgi:hypothetical protein
MRLSLIAKSTRKAQVNHLRRALFLTMSNFLVVAISIGKVEQNTVVTYECANNLFEKGMLPRSLHRD